MQEIIFEKPYKFIPPYRGTFWSSFIQRSGLIEYHLRKSAGIVSHEVRHAERLKQSIVAGHGIILSPNHSRMSDPISLGFLCRKLSIHIYAMAGWHLFQGSGFMAWAIRNLGAFSIYREGPDRASLNMAIDLVTEAERPLGLFPEGITTLTNDRLMPLLDGIALIARTAAKRRAKIDPDHKVVIHPVGLRYLFLDDLDKAIEPVLRKYEDRFTWREHPGMSPKERILRIGQAMLISKEIEFFGDPQHGTLRERLDGLVERLLIPLEEEWLEKTRPGEPCVQRVKDLRMRILPDMITGSITADERQRRWRQFADIYLAQQIASYPADYLKGKPSVDRLMDILERFEEDLEDFATVHGRRHLVIDVGEPIEVALKRPRSESTDPLMVKLQTQMQNMIDQLAQESRPYEYAASSA